MASVETKIPPGVREERPPLPLQSGDHLSSEEFERRYHAMPDLKKAELIQGVVYVPSPVTFDDHAGPHFDLITWLGIYRTFTPPVRGGDNATLRLDLGERPQPDALLFVLPQHGGRVRIDPDGYLRGGPDFLAEVAASTASLDLNDKLETYKRVQVREYLVWRVLEKAIDWFVLKKDDYELLTADQDGIHRSRALPGLWLDAPALIRGDMPRVFQVNQQGVQSEAHQAFVEN